MSLKKLRRQLAIDQRNVITATVTATGTGKVTVRSDKNESFSASSSAGYVVGDQVQVRVDGQQREVIGDGLRSNVSGVSVYQFDSGGAQVTESYNLIDENDNTLVDENGNLLSIF